MKALVAGGTGFIGSHIIEGLLSEGIQVKVFARKKSNIRYLRQKKIELILGNIFDINSFKHSIKDVDLVYSAFGILGQWGIPDKSYWEVNCEGVKNLLEGCIDQKIKQFIHISSAGVLGPLPDGVVADESFPYNPSNIYEKTKCESEKEASNFCEKHGIPYTIIRPEFVYGSGDRHVLGLFRSIKTGRFFILGNGKSLLHPTYIDDLIEGINLCTNNESAFGKIYLISGSRPISVSEVSQTIADQLKVSLPKIRIPLIIARAMAAILEPSASLLKFNPVLTKARVRFFTENRAFSCRKARDELGFAPRIDFREGVGKTIHWYEKNGYL